MLPWWWWVFTIVAVVLIGSLVYESWRAYKQGVEDYREQLREELMR